MSEPWTKETILELYDRHGWDGIVTSFNACLAAEREKKEKAIALSEILRDKLADYETLPETIKQLREQLAAEREKKERMVSCQ